MRSTRGSCRGVECLTDSRGSVASLGRRSMGLAFGEGSHDELRGSVSAEGGGGGSVDVEFSRYKASLNGDLI